MTPIRRSKPIPRSLSTVRAAIAAGLLTLAAGCAQLDSPDGAAETPKLAAARESYVQCVTAEAAKEAGTMAGAEDIAVAAQGRCWTRWDAYRVATYTTFAAGAATRDEQQLAHDKADAQLRQIELETRRSVVDRIVQRTLTPKP
jgi:hypothetical protein